MDTLIKKTDIKLERIDYNFEMTSINLKAGNKELKEAVEYISKSCVNYYVFVMTVAIGIMSMLIIYRNLK